MPFAKGYPLVHEYQLVVGGRRQRRLIPDMTGDNANTYQPIVGVCVEQCGGAATTTDEEPQLLVDYSTQQLEHLNDVALASTIGTDQDIHATELHGGMVDRLVSVDLDVPDGMNHAGTLRRQAWGGSNLEVRVIPAARPLAARTVAILREASSIISSPSMTAPRWPPSAEV